MSFWCPQFFPNKEWKQVDLRFHSNKVGFVCSFFGRKFGLKKSFRLCLTFSPNLSFQIFSQKKDYKQNKVFLTLITFNYVFPKMFPSAFLKIFWALGGKKCRTRNLNPGSQGQLDPNWHHIGIHICHFWAMVGPFWSKPLPVQDFRLPLHEIWHHQIVETLSNQIRVVAFINLFLTSKK